MADNELSIRISADASRLVAGVDVAVSKLKDLSAQAGQMSSGLKASGQAAEEATAAISSFAGGMVTKLAGAAAAVISLREAVVSAKKGINFSDEIRDLSTSLSALERSTGSGVATLEKFRESADRTRNTAVELATAFREAIPAAIRRGISDQTLSSLTVQIAKIAPLLGQGLQETMSQLDQIMVGKGRLMRNPLLNLLLQGTGFSAEDITKGLVPFQQVWTAMLPNIDVLTTKGEAMGQTFETVFKKIKESMLTAFAEGFAGGEKGYQGLLDAFRDPQLLEAIKQIGEAIKAWLPIVEKLAVVASVIAGIATVKPGRGATGPPTLGGTGFEDLGFTPPLSAVGMGDVQLADAASRLKAITTEVGKTKDKVKEVGDALAVAFDPDKFQKLSDAVDAFARKSADLTPLETKLTAIGNEAQRLIDEAQEQMSPFDLASKEAKQYEALIFQVLGATERLKAAVLTTALAEYWNKAAEAARRYSDEIEKTRQSIALGVSEHLPAGVASSLEAQANDLAAIYTAALNSPDVRMAMDTSIEEASKQIVAGYKTAGKVIEDSGKKAAEELSRAGALFAKNVIDPLTAAFTDLATTGGKNFGQVMAQAFSGFVSQGAGDLINSLFGITKTTDASGKTTYKYGTQSGLTLSEAQGAFAKASPGLALGATSAIAIAGAAQTGYTTTASDLQNAVGAIASAAALVGSMVAIYGSLLAIPVVGWVAAAAVAVGQVVGKLLQPSPGSHYQYATGVGVSATGVFGGRPNENIDKNTWMQIVATGQATFESFYNAYYKLLMKFPTELLPDVSKAFNAVYGEFEHGADLGRAASEKFAQELASFLATGLPHEIGARFNQYLKADFATLGVTAAAWDATWKKLILLEPKAQIQALNDWVDGLLKVQEALKNIARPTGIGNLNLDTAFNLQDTVFGQNAIDNAKTYADKLADADKKIIEFGQGLDHLVGAELLASEKQLAQMTDDLFNQIKGYVQEISKAMAESIKSTQDQINQYKLEGMVTATGAPDVAAQIAFLKKQADLLYQQVGNAPDAAGVLAIQKQIQSVIDQIVQLGKAQGPEAAAAYLQWGQQVLGTIQESVLDRLTALGGSIDTINQQFLGQFQPIYDIFLQGLAGTGDAASVLTTNLDNASGALDDFTGRVLDASAALAAIALSGGAQSGDSGFASVTASRR